MATGNLTKMLLHTKVTRYLDFKSIAGSYVYKAGKIIKIPATPNEAIYSPLMSLFEKRRFRNFLIYVDQYKEDDPATQKGRNLAAMTMRELYTDFGLVPDTQQFISHAMCLELDEMHMDKPALGTVKELQTYCYSMSRYGTSPYIYPLYGLGGLPEGFSRICAIHGGTFMLNQDIDEILFNDSGEAYGVKAGNQMAKANMVIGDPSYFPPEKIKPTGVVVRCICILNHPIPDTNNAESAQIVIPGPQVGRVNDIFVCCVSNGLQVSASGVYIAIVSTLIEKGNPDEDIAPEPVRNPLTTGRQLIAATGFALVQARASNIGFVRSPPLLQTAAMFPTASNAFAIQGRTGRVARAIPLPGSRAAEAGRSRYARQEEERPQKAEP